MVTDPLRFLINEWLHRGPSVYQLRGGRQHIVIRHDAGSLELLHEIFRRECYMPAPVLASNMPDKPRVLDLGANVGAFAAFALSRWPEAQLTCVEPDPDNLAALTKFSSLHPDSAMTLIEACATNEGGMMGFAAGLGTGSRASEDAPPVPAIDVLPLLKDTDFAKIDIEGSEWSILRDPRLCHVNRLLMVLEYHRRYPFDTGAADEVQNLLRAAGFTVCQVESNYWGHGLIWAVKS